MPQNITIKSLTLAEVDAQFPGAHRPENEIHDSTKIGLFKGRLLSACDEGDSTSWSTWDGMKWRELRAVDHEMLVQLEVAGRIIWSP